jgi:hypothetical protein
MDWGGGVNGVRLAPCLGFLDSGLFAVRSSVAQCGSEVDGGVCSLGVV